MHCPLPTSTFIAVFLHSPLTLHFFSGCMCTLNSANRDRVIKFDGVDLMVTFMNKHPTNEAIQQEACLAINNLCINNGKTIIIVEPK